jgi:hypothetical protein
MNALLSVIILVTITNNNFASPEAPYTWSFQSESSAVDPTTGNVALSAAGETQITYQLDSESATLYQLIYANLDPQPTATLQIESVQTDPAGTFITITDCNCGGPTGANPFSLRLVARKKNDITSGFLSPDPQVTNVPHPP